MNSEEYQNLCAVNRALIRFRGAYAAWAAVHSMSHTEMLALYDLRDDGICTQKRICTRYRIPPQTVNHTILNLRTFAGNQIRGPRKGFRSHRSGPGKRAAAAGFAECHRNARDRPIYA